MEPTATVVTTADERIKLPDGRWLAYTEYGDPTGTPIFYFHGTPGSRLEPHPDAAHIAALGVRMITTDRPGYGLSDFQRGRRLLDWPSDVAHLADALHIERFAVLSNSGGGPHALACAYRLRERVTRAGVVCSPSPLDAPDIFSGVAVATAQRFTMERRLPWPFLRLVYGLQGRTFRRDPGAFVRMLQPLLPEVDWRVLDDPARRQGWLESFRIAYRAGTRAHAWESRILAGDWGFRPQDIRVETYLWHGDADTLTPVTMGHYLAAVIPGCQATFFPNEGHLSTFTHHWREIVLALVA